MASYNDPTSVGQYVTKLMGYQGPFGSGEAVNYRSKFSPQQQQQYNQMVQQMGGNVPLTQAQTNFNSGGVVPVGQIEPFNQYQKDALTGLAQPNAAGNQFFDQAAGAVGQSQQQLTPDVFNQMVGQYMNPYQQQVVDSTIGRINDAGSRAQSSLMASQAGRRSFGDSSSAIQQAELQKNLMQQIGDTTAQLNQSGFNSAATMGQNQFNTQRAMNLTGAQAYNTLGQGGYDRRQQDLTNMYGAGSQIQQQNQNLLNVAAGQIGAKNQYPYTQVSQLGQLLGMMPSSTGNTYNQTPNNMSTLGGLGMTLGGMFSQNQSAALPWQAAGNVNPLGGYY